VNGERSKTDIHAPLVTADATVRQLFGLENRAFEALNR